MTVASETFKLDTDVALAVRIIRMGHVPRSYFYWLSAPQKMGDCADSLAETAITKSLDEIFTPLLADAREWEKKEARYAAKWIGAVCRYITNNARSHGLGIHARMLAASLLPTYRCLATGELHEGLKQTRARLAELLSLFSLVTEIGEDLVHALDNGNRTMSAPSAILKDQFGLQLTSIAETVLKYSERFEPSTSLFDDSSTEELLALKLKGRKAMIEEWAAPELLWRLSGEMISKNSELVLPRSWLSSPVPWASISDHWHALAHLLATTDTNTDTKPCESGGTESLMAKDSNSTARSDPARLESLESDGPTSEVSKLPVGQPEVLRAESSSTPNLAAIDAPDLPIAPPPVALELPLPKVLIAEIRSHNDPAFVNVVRRQIAKCRAEDRAISLVSIVVLPEDENDHHDVRENGLTLWQQKLVNWLADHPQVIEPYAFLTGDGELILCVLDLERGETTNLVRHGLVEVLTGKHVDDTGSLLAKVNVPARYHAGIASTSAPAAAFTPEQLIEPAVRCLSAASRQGKASIKSIEVY